MRSGDPISRFPDVPIFLSFSSLFSCFIEGAEFSTYGGNHSIELFFKDKTALSLGMEPGFTLFADYADWKSGNWRPVRRWAPVRSRLLRE